MQDKILEIIMWSCAASVVIITIGYPVLLFVSSLFVRRAPVSGQFEPTVSLIISAYNEASVIASKLDNSLALDYPAGKLEIIVASDGSTDNTNAIVRSYADRGVTLAAFPRSGKTGVQNLAADMARGEILLFSDANAMYRSNAVSMLTRNFADENVGGVCGQLDYKAATEGAGRSEGSYWRYERFMKIQESRLSSVVGANGSIYAVRKSDYVPLNPGLISDFVEPLALVRAHKRFVYEPEAVSVEDASRDYNMEFKRKIRILTRSIRGLLSMAALMNPFRYGIFSLQLFLHKFCRFITPIFLIAGALSLVALAANGRYQALLATAATGILLSVWLVRVKPDMRPAIVGRVCHLLYYYLMANTALVIAWTNVLRGNHMKLWSPERSTNS